MLSNWSKSLKQYLNRRMLVVFLLGMCSGIPNALMAGTLSIWLRELGLNRTNISGISIIGLVYAINFLWAPLLDRVQLVGLHKIGQRRSWLTLLQIALVVTIYLFSLQDPSINLTIFIILAAIVAFLSASQDIVIDAYRIEFLEPKEYAAGSAMTTFGWFAGAQIIASYFVLHFSEIISWNSAYVFAGLALLIGPVVLFFAGEPKVSEQKEQTVNHYTKLANDWLINSHLSTRVKNILSFLYVSVIAPFKEFASRPGWLVILLFIVFFKLGEALLGKMSGVFYVDLGFSAQDIANYSKLLGLGSIIVGGLIGGVFARRFGIFPMLFTSGVLMASTNLLYMWMAAVGKDYQLFAIAIIADNLTSGMTTTIFVAFISSLCNKAFTATQYALFASLANFAQRSFGASSGAIVDVFESMPIVAFFGGAWSLFFLLTVVLAIPGLYLLVIIKRRYSKFYTAVSVN